MDQHKVVYSNNGIKVMYYFQNDIQTKIWKVWHPFVFTSIYFDTPKQNPVQPSEVT